MPEFSMFSRRMFLVTTGKTLSGIATLCLVGCPGSEEKTNDNVPNVLMLEAESFNQKIQSPNGRIRIEDKPHASNMKCVHIGPDSNIESDGIGDTLIFNFSLGRDFSVGVFEVQYSDDVGGNIIHVYLDNEKQGSFRTETTGGWDTFAVDSQKINLGLLSKHR